MSSEYEPFLTEPLKASYIIREGHPVKLSCRFDASPKGSIQWLKDGIPIDFEALGISRDFKVVKEVDYTALLIKEAFQEDAGSYTVVIRNALGEARSYTQLTVEDYFCRTPESEMSDTPCKPVFVQSLRDTTINEGQKLKLHAAINAHPEPEIIWYRNDIPLKNSRDLMLTFDGQLCTLTKDRCEKENDTGIYRIAAVNSMGQAESVCQVIVQSNDTQIFRERLQSTRSIPVFIQPLQDKTVYEGEKLLLQARVNGQPKPQVIWYKDNQSLSNSYEHQIRTENDISILEISRLSKNHAGFYEAKAINMEGETKCSAFINVLPPSIAPEPMITQSTGFSPEFIQLFSDTKTSIGSTIKFEARIIGTQPLNVYWLFNGSPITPRDNKQLNIVNDTYTLTIYNVRYEDIGKYTLNVENSWGKATCTAELFVPPTIFRVGIDNNSQNMLSNLLMKMSPSPPVPRKRQIETNQQQQSSDITRSFEQESSFISSNNNKKRSRPLLSHSLTRNDDYRHVRQYPKTLEIFKPQSTNEKQTTITRSYEYQVEKKRRSSSENLRQQRTNNFQLEREYLRCLDDLQDEYDNLKRQKKSFDNQKNTTTYETTEQYERIEQTSHQPRIDQFYQRSSSENILHKRLKPIHIHSSTNSIPGETSIKYVSIERSPVEVLLPKPQIYTTQGEHTSTIVKDTRNLTRKITTNIHQQPRRRTIEGQHELRIIEKPITSGQTRPVEFTIPKPIETLPVEHSSTFVVKSKKGGRFHTLDISSTLTREHILSGEHELRVISQPIRSSLHNKPVEFSFPKPILTSSQSSQHSSTVVKQNRTPKSSLILDNIQTILKGEHELRYVEKPIQSGPGDSVEFIVPKSVTDTVEHTSTFVTTTQPQRRVLEITGSGKKQESEHETKYFQDTVRIEEALEVKLPKQKHEQVEHSSTIIKHSRGKGPIIEIDTTQKTIEGEHELKIVEDSIETKTDTMELLVPKPKIPSKHSTTIIKGQRGKSQILTIDRRQTISGEHQTKYYNQPIESYGTMEVIFPKQQPILSSQEGEHMSTLIKNVHPKPVVYTDRLREIPGEHSLTIVENSDRKIDQRTENEVEFRVPRKQPVDHYKSSSDYEERFVSSTNEEEEILRQRYPYQDTGEHSTTYLKQTQAKYQPIDLVVDRPKQLPSISKLIVDFPASTQITSIRPTKFILPENSSFRLDTQSNREQFNEMELVLEKPLVRDSSTTLIANIQPGLELKSIQPTQQTITKESSSTLTMQREQQSEEEELLELRIRRPYIKDSSSILLADVQSELSVQGQLKPSPYIPQSIEESSTALMIDLQRAQEMKPFELIIPRIDVESSTSTVLAQVSPAMAGQRTKIDIPKVEKSTSSFLLEQTKRSDKEIEVIMLKPKHMETSTSTMIADVQAKLETKNIRPSEIQPEISTSTLYFEETIHDIIPQPVELRMKQPTIADSSTTLFANVKATLDTQQIQILGNSYRPLEQSSSTILFENQTKEIQPAEVELIFPRPLKQESTSVMLANIRPTLDTSQTPVVTPSPFQSPIKSSSQRILEQEKIETTSGELHSHRQPSSHIPTAEFSDSRITNEDIFVLGTGNQQQPYGSPRIHADLNKPLELIFNVEEGNRSSISQRDYNSRLLTNTLSGIDSTSTSITELQPRQFQPVQFRVSGGLTGYNNTVEQYSTGVDNTGYTTTKTTTTRTLTSSDTGGYNEKTNRSTIRGIKPFDQVDLVLQPDTSLLSSSKVLTTNTSLNQGYAPYFSLALHDQTVREGESVLFEVIVSAQPSAEIIWDKNGTLIGDDSPFRIDYYGNGRATLYIPEAFADDQGYYTCTVTNTHGTYRTTSRLTIDSSGEGPSPKRRQLDNSSSVSYRQGPTQTIESYRVYSKPSTTVTEVTEETQVYQIPSRQQHNEISYSIQGSQPKYQPVSFLVSASQENTQPNITTTTTITTDEEDQSLFSSPYQNLSSQLRTRPYQNVIPSYGDETSQTSMTTTTMYSQRQQQPRNTGLIATVAKQPGPTYSNYQLPSSQESDSMQTESETLGIRFARSIQQQPGPTYSNYQLSTTQESDSMQTESETSGIRFARSIQQQQQQPQPVTTSQYSTRPNFTKPLEAVDAVEGGTVQITVHLTAVGPQQTRPQIQWYHHAQPIVSDNQHYRITEGYDTSTLEIIHVKKNDTGQVWCVANTPAGSATTTCTINVEEKPVRSHHHVKSSQQQVVPQETIYETESIHSTHAQIPLHHQQPDQRVPSQFYSTQTITQQQISPQSFTSQTPLSYQQQQVSPKSYSSTSYQQPQPQAPFQSYAPQQPSPLQSQQAPFQSYAPLQPSPLQSQQAPFQSYAPQQPSPLQSQQAPFQSYAPLQPSPLQSQQAPFQPYAPQQQSPLQSQYVPSQPFIPQQQQPQTSSQSSIPQAPPLLPNFNARPTYSDQQVKIINGVLQDQPLYTEGETVFECQFTGKPDKIQWFRNDVEIINNSQQLNNRIYHITNQTNGTSRLIIKTTLAEDVGTYSVKLTGPTGEETGSAKLIPASQFQNIQKKKVDQVQRKALVQELEEKQLKRMRPSKTVAPQGTNSSYGTSDEDVFYETNQRVAPHRHPTAPVVSRPLKDLDVKEGQPIQLTCQVQGFPKSELLWFKNNIPLPLSARHKTAYEAGSGTITLRITDSRPEDSGVYTVIAKNPQGHVQISAQVDVQESPGIDETSYVQPDAFKYIEKQPVGPRPAKVRRESDTSNLQQKPAKIVKTPISTSIVEGETAQFTCQVEGHPKPKVAWLKDNKPLMAGPRFSTYFDQTSKTAVLRVKDVCKEDQGYYTCIVDNILNSDRSTATLQVIAESKIDQRSYVETDAFKYLTPENKQLRTANKENNRPTSGVDNESFVSPESFRYLEAKKPLKSTEDNLTIDDRPIVDADAFRYIEARQAPKGKKEDDIRPTIDDTPIIAPDAFRYLERKADAAKLKKGQDTGPSIDETPQVNLTAFQYLERREIPKKPEEGPSIDESSIVNPEAFKYLERKPMKKPEDVGPLIDESPIVNPDAFRYLERQTAPQSRDTTPAIDTTPLVNPEVFKYLEKPTEIRRVDESPAIDTRPIVPQEAFRWLDRPKPLERIPEGPSVDQSSYVNPKAFRYIEAKPKEKVVDTSPSIDNSSYVNPQAFKYLEGAPSKKPVDHGPAIDTSNYVNPQLFAQFEQKPVPQATYNEEEIHRAPTVVQPLKSTQTIEGKPVALVAIVDGFPVPQLTWLKDGAELPASNRVTTNYDIPSRTAWIRIDNVRPDDTSVYTLMAHNTAGEVRSDARLNVVPSSTAIDNTAFVAAEAFEKIERASAPNRSNIPATTGVDDTSFVNPKLFQQFESPLKPSQTENFTNELVVQVPARILTPLKSLQALESVTVVLEAIVEGSPMPTFTWLKDRLPLSESNRFITNYDLPSKRVTLTIKDVRESDTATYTLLASNGPQLEHSSATLQVIGAPSIDRSSFIPMDVFKQLERPQNQQPQILVQSGVDQTSFVSQPDRFAVFDQIQPHRRPLNDFGGVDETPLVSMEKIRLLEIPSNAMKQPYDVEEKTQAPTVLTPLQPISAQEGTPVVLTAKINGSPMPNFTWSKDNAPLVASSRFTTYYDIPSKLIVLQINDARPDDTGVYTVRADNKSGDVSTSATLNISSLPSVRDQSFIPTDKFRLLEQPNQPRYIQDISGVDERPLVDLTKLQQLEIKPAKLTEEEQTEQYKPTVVIPLRNVQAIENQPVVLSAQIEGKPHPQFTWFKNNQPLNEGNRFRTHYDIPSKTIFLTVAGAREDDSGIYRLVAQNPSGQEETSCEVNVDVNQPNIDQRSFVPQTAFDKLEKPLLKFNNVTSGVDQTSFFNQDLFRPLDERNIKHPSAIVGGEDSDAAMPVSGPKVLTPLRPITTTEGDTVLLTTQVEGYPLPQFTWVHNNQPLMASNRVTSHYDMLTKRCYLQILDSRPTDAGTYELIAENPAGQDRTRTELTIVPVSKIDQTGYVPYDKFSTLEFKPRIPSDLRSGVDATPFVSGEIFRLLEAKPINEHYIPEEEQNLPLEILVPLKPAIAQEGQPVILTTKIRGRPIPQFTWLRNNQPILESNRFQTYYDFPSETLVLEISDIWPHDSGNYTVIAENPKTGERVETSAPLTVRGDTTSIDRTAFVAPDAFRTLEAALPLRTVMVQPGVDTNSFLKPDVLRALDQIKPKPIDVQEKQQPLIAPKVIVPLQPINSNEGQPINFTAKVEGNPQPTFTWFKNGQPLQESNRFWSHYDVPSKTVLLQINGARPDDSGTYVLVAENPLGRDQTQTAVNVTFGPRVDTNAFVAPEKFAAFDQPYGQHVPTQSGVDTTPFVQPERFAQLELKAPPPTKEDMQQLEAPKVIKPLQTTQVNEGSPVLLHATVVGKPTPNFVWMKDGAPLAASNRLRTRYDIGTKQVLLQINDVRPQDIGEYLVIATNPAGEDSTVCSLNVVPDKPGVDDRAFVPTDKFRNLEHPQGQALRPLEIVPAEGATVVGVQRPPRVMIPLNDGDIEELMPVILTTTIDSGAPMATFTWFKNGQPLLEGNRFTTKYDILPKTLTLQILAARPDDQGVYTVRATNPFGNDETTCKLNIQPVSSVDTRPFVQPERFAQLELKAPPPTKEDMQQLEAPKVIKPLQTTQVNEGSPVLLHATIVGKPTPNFVWMKDGAPLAASNRLRTRYDIGTKQVLLQINDVRPQDIGEYLVIATNPAGEDSTVCSLNVVPDKPGVDDRAFVPIDKFRNLEHPQGQARRPLEIVPAEGATVVGVQRPPRVMIPLNDGDIEELMPVILTTTIDSGAPMATFTWFKNGQPLLEGNRFTTKYDILPKTLTLQILAARPDDQGVYTVRATNPFGNDETTCKLNIRPVSSVDTRPFVQPERFAQLELKAPPPTKEDMQQLEAPKVIVPLQSTQINEGSPVLLHATIVGKPTPNFVWLKDGAPLAASNRLRTRYDIGTKQVLLQINDVRPQDIGEYLVIATNPAGEDSTVCSLSVVPDKPGVDDRAFVPTDKFRNLEHPQGQARRPLEIVPGVDIQPLISPDKFRNLNNVSPMARTEEGEIVVEEQRPPRVVVPLSDGDIEELMPVLLTATVDAGAPMATFTWFKNGQPLLEGNRFTTKYDIVSRIITLQILAARPDDQGVYTVRATNPSGSDETTCKLTIRPVSSVDTRPFVDAEHFRPLENRPATARSLGDENQTLRPPKVLVPMNNIRLTEYQPIVLKSIIDAGFPMGKFIWRKDGHQLPESNRYRANFDIHTRTASLFIDAARPATDNGRYTVHVENIVGKDETTGEVNVEGTPAIDDRPFIEPSKFGKFEGPLRTPSNSPRGPILQPNDLLRDRENLSPWIRLLKGLEDQLIDETKAPQLVCVVDAHPPATINWFKDGHPLVVSQRFMPDYDSKTGIVRLTIYPVNAADSGQYTMVARNIAGEVSTKCTLRIQPTASVEDNPLVKFAGLRKTPQHPSGPGSEPSHKPVNSDEGQKPYFIKVPVDREVPEGQLVRLDYIPAGRPEPSLTWYRNGIPLQPNDADHRDVVNEGGVHSLLILNPQLGPAIEYTCVAKNKYGEAPFTVHITVAERGSKIAPYFIEQLYNIIIIEGQDAILDASAQGFPEPHVSWEKEGKPLTPNKEYKVEFEGAKTTLYIRGAKMVDAGWYQCTAISPAGKAITKCKVTVIPLSQAGQYAKDLPQLGSHQLPKIPTLPEEDIRSKYMTVPMKPPDVKPEELYKLPKRAKKPDSSALEEAKRRGVKVLPDEIVNALQKSLEEFPEEEMYSKDRPQPPKFKVHIKSHLNLNEDDHCLFEAKLIPVRDPMMRVQWFKNGKVLHHASRMIPRYDFADVSLEFLWTFAEDDGIYECVATNPYGEDRTRAELKCRPKRSIIYNTQLPGGMEGVSKLQMLEDEIRYTASMIGLEEKVQEKEPKAPEFIMPLEDISLDEGDNAKFIAKVDGHPRPRVTWSINNSDIANGSRYKLVYDGLVHYLDIPRTRQYDAGIVRCTAKNSLGQAESVAMLKLKLRQDYRSALSKTPGGIDTGLDDSFDVDIEERLRLRSQLRQRESVDERTRLPPTDKPIHPLHSKAIDRMSWHQTVEKTGDAPSFTKPLLPLKAKEGSKVVVSVEFTGDPPPTVSWYRDGFMVEDSEDFKIHTTSTQSILTIKHAYIIDSGLYTIKLFNPIGIKQCQAAIRIMPIIAEDQTPRFLDVPQDSEILAGDPVRFQCRVEGEPFPTVAFYREDEPVNLNDRRFRVIQEGDVFTLLLFEALPADSGQYEAVAENSVGKANTRFTLIVTPRVTGGKKASIVDDPKLIHKVPYLEKPLEDLHVKEGQSATFECIIPASFGSDVKWYKGTSEWPIKPSKFFKPKSDGTKHQLFILEAYAEDEGLYKCVVSNPVGTTATTATIKVDHSMQVPEFVQGFSNLTTYEGEEVRFEVEVRGDPPPIISWYRDGEIIRDSPDFQIFTEGNRSLFYISEVFMEDQGLFTCTASNSAGSSDCSAHLVVQPRPQL